ncbi:hypothetical protein [Neisseria iguanae]|uniref:Uncharacterized protein n=1 Tax=Neisseria iguanae TaxID=90242 RepID=A0A2P7TYF2_9NEIS|nr:hypothetical protein [Neisseria iguanae]PSJ79756.1 hypothetical protein C7N83_10295 [Neisseria iguanae]
MESLGQDLYGQTNAFCRPGDNLADEGRFNEALKQYKETWTPLPGPKAQQEASMDFGRDGGTVPVFKRQIPSGSEGFD